MATTTRQPKPVKQLKEHLQEKQDPFVLDLYLVERGCLTNSFNSRKSLKRSVSCLKVFRAVYSRLKITSSNHRNGNVVVTENNGRDNKEAAELDRFSSASSSTMFNSCSTGSDAEDTPTTQQKDQLLYKANTSQPFILCNPIEKEAVADRKLRWQCIEESRQLSPVSVLEEAASHSASQLHKYKVKDSKSSFLFPKKVTEDSILSASLRKVLFQSENQKKPTLAGVSEIQELVQSNNNNASSRYLKSNSSALQQTRQLLFDCVREIVDNQERKEKPHQQQQEYLASEYLGKHVIGDKIKCWGKQSGEASNLAELLQSDLLDSVQEWNGFESQRREIGFEIGNAISEEMETEIIADMIDFLSPINGC
ncbi:uncharacterized protein LOC8265258 [Ricinus communis]|uniref:uncharacterized protein LOC8265258 n=1 Tax=Ricinus communis TaxID=3988 RepID=UPI0007721D24|nr:uncharacterized protein LOC8265258 [Ricinus communis]|eukprot:XP_015576012.1 uncharacterized protein LOC8265258 [Ricinus communis]